MKNKLEQLIEMRTLPFYSNNSRSEENINDHKRYNQLEAELEAESKLLKKGDKVMFNFPKKVKDSTDKFFGFRIENQLLIGTVTKPYYNKKRQCTHEYETILIPTLKCESGQYIYEVSPNAVVKI